MTVAGRWHIGGLVLPGGAEPELDGGRELNPTAALVAESVRPGVPLDFCLTSFGVPVASGQLACALAAEASTDVQVIPIEDERLPPLFALNATRAIECVDEDASEFIKWTERDHRADLAGQFRQVTRLRIDRDRIPGDASFFRVKGWLVALIVTGEVRRAMEEAGCTGALFVEV